MGYRDITIQYGSETISHFIPENTGTIQVIDAPETNAGINDLPNDLTDALENPLEAHPLKELVRRHYPGSGKKILLLADDNTRPNLHTRMIYPHLLNYLIQTCGVKKEDLGILIASGTHRPPTEEEIKDSILGETIFSAYQDQILIHNDKENLVDLGFSKFDSPIRFNKDAYQACLLIPVTDSEYHYFAGVAGTVKQLFPGIAGRITTNTNHTRMFDTDLGFKKECRLGNTAGNPVITDMKEMARTIQDHVPVFCIDAIMDHGKITRINAGNILALHDLASDLLFQRRVVEVDRPADLVISTAGKLGINLYQAGKAIHAGWNAVKKPGGTILLLAPCQDGVGSAGYQDSMLAVQDMDLDQAMKWVIENTCNRDTFRIGNQKPVDILRIYKTLGDGGIAILSEMDPATLSKVHRLEPVEDAGSPQESLRRYLKNYLKTKPEALIYLLRDSGLYVVPGNE